MVFSDCESEGSMMRGPGPLGAVTVVEKNNDNKIKSMKRQREMVLIRGVYVYVCWC